MTHTIGARIRAGRPLQVRIATAMFAGGAGITLLSLLLPHPAEADERGWVGLVVVLGGLAALLWLKRWAREPEWLEPFTMVVAAGAVTASVYFNGERHGGEPLMTELYFLWVSLYAGYFLTPGRLALALLSLSGAYTGVLMAIGVGGGTLAMRALVTLSAVAGAAVAAAVVRRHVDRLVDRLRTLAATDPLTGVLNRRALHERLAVEVHRARRTGEPLSVLAGDVDRFKELNDRHGHPAGDAALASIAAALRDASRAVDVVARAGGEEFVVALPGTDEDGAMEAAERLRAAVSATTRPDGRPLTISFGVVTAHAPAGAPEDLLAAADEALYAAKAAGRDRSVAYRPAAAPAGRA